MPTQNLNKEYIMKNKLIFLITCVLFFSSFAFSTEDKVNETKEVLISSHLEYAKASIDRKCQKLKKKIRELENQLGELEKHSDGTDKDLIKKIRTENMSEIKKHEHKIDALRLVKLSLDTVNFNDL